MYVLTGTRYIIRLVFFLPPRCILLLHSSEACSVTTDVIDPFTTGNPLWEQNYLNLV